MGLKEKIGEKLGILVSDVSFQTIGDIILIKFQRKMPKNYKRKIASTILEILPNTKTVCEIFGIRNKFREPKIRIMAGYKTETIHKEHGILYKIDVSKVMFSKGNLYERQRLINQVKTQEIIVDMFAGIGYFSLGIAKFSKVKIIYAIEKNPTAFEFLKENIMLNKINNIVPILGDCREIAKQENFQGVADRVIMGYIKDTKKFLPSAFLFLKTKGIIHYHNTFKKEELWEKPIKMINRCAEENRYEVEKILGMKVVKSYAPNISHVVLDVKIRRPS